MLIIVPVRNLVLFPGTVVPVAINRERSLAAAQEAVRAERKVGFLLQQDPDLSRRPGDDLYKVGTVASIVRYVTAPDGTHHLVVPGRAALPRARLQSGLPFLVARVEFLPRSPTHAAEIEARALQLKRSAAEAVSLLPQAPAELANAIQAVESPATLADLIASFMDIKPADKQQILETVDLKARLDQCRRAAGAAASRCCGCQREIEEQTREAIDERQREVLLREQLRQIQQGARRGEARPARRSRELREAIDKAGMPRGGRGAGAQGAQAPGAHVRGERRVLDAAHLPRLAARSCRGRSCDEEAIDIETRAPRPRRGPLRPREDQAPHPRVPRGAQAQPAGPQPDPVLRRPAGRRQDLARPEHRARARAASSRA